MRIGRPADVARRELHERTLQQAVCPKPGVRPVLGPNEKMKDRAKPSRAGTMTEPSRTYNYNGYEMRSLAEARWAAFFDICGIRWQVEPISTGDYIPDFLLLGDAPTIVEVKGGATTLEQLVTQTEYVPERLRGHWNGDVLCLGAHPVLAVSRKGVVMGTIHESHYLPEDGEEWWRQLALASVCAGSSEHDSLVQGKRHDVPRFGIKPESGVYHLRPWDCYNGGHGVGNWPQADIEAKWAEATNRVRYLHGGAKG